MKKKIEEKILELYQKHRANLQAQYNWENEHDRFVELSCCFMAGITRIRLDELREIVAGLSRLDLFDIEALSNAAVVGGNNMRGNLLVSIIKNILLEKGIEEKNVEKCVSVICKLAKVITEKYDGKMQKFLRKYGDMMLKEMNKIFSFDEVNKLDLNYVLTLWLQNVMEMPVIMSNEIVRQYCKMNRITLKDLETAADKLNINTAALDDLIQIYMIEEKGIYPFAKKTKSQKG